MKEFLHLTQRFIRISGESLKFGNSKKWFSYNEIARKKDRKCPAKHHFAYNNPKISEKAF